VLELTNNNIKNIVTTDNICKFLSNIYTLKINISSYSRDCEILIFSQLYNDFTYLLPNIKTCYISKEINHKINLPSTCEIIYFENIKKIKLMKQFNEYDDDDDDDEL
jgi:hypothetical protein